MDLDRLAELVGIEPFYWDIWGNWRGTSPETKRALIGAMGLAAATGQDIADSVRMVDERTWCRLLPPVQILLETEPVVIGLSLSADHQGASVRWRLEEESGAVHHGEADLTCLERCEESRLDGIRYQRHALPVLLRLPLGYHRLSVEIPGVGVGAMSLIIAPERCIMPHEVVPDGRVRGVGLQLYSLRSQRNWGLGDFGDLARFAELAGRHGAGLVGLNPLHALFPADPHHYSPYSPSSRSFLNILYIDVPAVPDLEECAEARARIESAEFQQALAAARAGERVDYPAAARLKLPVLELLYRSFRHRHLDHGRESARARAYHAFQEEMGEALYRQALFDALHEHFHAQDPALWSWRNWPEPFRRPDSEAVAQFGREHAERVGFFQYLQWIADLQLEAAARAARDAGMAVGLYRDLAVADHPGGAAAWSFQDIVLQDANVGAPPDQFAPQGQNWGLSPLSPVALREAAYEPFISALRANMRHAGAMRIDHVMALQHLFWVPRDGSPGAYVQYPLQDLIRLVALESRRNRCLVIGEDLGTVPENFRPAMARAGVLSYRVLYFERYQDGNFHPPESYPPDALVTVTTHDLPTLQGFWIGEDIRWRERLGLYPDQAAREQAWRDRERDRWQLVEALDRAGLLPEATRPRDGHLPGMTMELAAAVHRYLARTPGRILMLQIEDALGETGQPNLPGTVEQHPNWRRKLSCMLEDMAHADGLRRLMDAVGSGHPRS